MSGLRGCATLVSRAVAGLGAAALVLLLPVTLLARNIALVLFEPQALTQAVSERLIESGLLRETIVGSLLGEGAHLGALSLDAATSQLSAQDREELIDLLVPEAWVKDQILQVTTQFFGWFDDASTRLVLTMDTGPVTAGLKGEAAGRAIEMVVESWPSCTLEDVGKMIGLGAMPGDEGFPFCEPPEPLRGVVVGALTGALRVLGESLPDRLVVVDRGFEDSDRLMQAKEQVRMLRFVARWGVLVCLALLGGITVLGVRSWKGLTRWWGMPLLLGGTLAFLPVLFGGRVLHLLVSRLTAGLSGLPALTELAQALAEAVVGVTLRPQAWQALLVSLLGLILVALSFVGRRSPPPAPASPEPESNETSPDVPPEPIDDNRTHPSGMFG